MTVRDRNDDNGQERIKQGLYWVAGGAALLGFAILVGSIPAFEDFPALTNWPATLAPAGASLLVGALAGSVALTAVVSWRKQREIDNAAEATKRANDRNFEVWRIRATYYDKIAISAVQQFARIGDLETMAADRGRAVLWGSAAVVQALEAWDIEAGVIRAEQDQRGDDSENSDEQKGRLWNAFSHLIQTMRAELPDDQMATLTNRQILRAIFSDYRHLDGIGKLPTGLN
ncbi:hypothetical protein [Cryobacterium sp. CG_9.6]|uniref:hypothetical protein n=1 Tax=Cryobacterium sp. CG_9.6 TaxID=2760710 RepID=UPI0024759AA2|nr:hypothetical protein [Cryobacterium sp. CG_9.6]MDH6236274.1 hypothetical protein [Cryobacterium sp. CG_9.6]